MFLVAVVVVVVVVVVAFCHFFMDVSHIVDLLISSEIILVEVYIVEIHRVTPKRSENWRGIIGLSHINFERRNG